jgi:hypothetical protein
MLGAIKKTAKPGEFVIAHHGGIVGLVLEVVKDNGNTRYKIASGNRNAGWVFHDELSSPRRGSFGDLVRFYDSLVRLFDRMAGLAGDIGEKVRANIFEFIIDAALKISRHKNPNHEIRRVMLDFGTRAGFDDKHMAEGRAIMNAA